MASCLTATAQLATLDGDLDRAVAEYERAERYLEEFGASGDMTFARARDRGPALRQGDVGAARATVDRMVVDAAFARRAGDDRLRAGPVLRAEGDIVGAPRPAGAAARPRRGDSAPPTR